MKEKSGFFSYLIILCTLFIQDVDAKQILRRSLDAEPVSLYLPHVGDFPSYFIARDLYEGLVLAKQDGSIMPGLAEKWDIEDDGKLYRFHLRKNAKWSNGDPVTAHDFVFAWQHLADPKTASVYAYMLNPLLNAEKIIKGEEKDLTKLGVNAISDSILEVQLNATTPYFINILLHNTYFPFHKSSFEKHGKEVSKPGKLVSNGAFTLQAWRPNESILLAKNPYYWDQESVKLDEVHYFPTDDQNTILKKYRAGELDLTYSVPAERFKQIKDDPILSKDLRSQPYLSTFYYGINQTKEPLGTSKELREALSLVIDRELLTEKIIGAGEKPAYCLVPHGTSNAIPQNVAFKDMPMAERIERAKQLYAQAGYSEKNPFKVTFTYNTSENYKKIALAVVDMWKQHFPGIQVGLQNMEWKVFLQERQEKKNLEIFRSGWVGDYNDPNAFLDNLVTKAGYNDLGYASPEFDELVKKGAVTSNLKERAEILGQAEKHLLEDHILIPLYHTASNRLVKPYVEGYNLTSTNVLDIFYSKDLSINR